MSSEGLSVNAYKPPVLIMMYAMDHNVLIFSASLLQANGE